MLPNLTKKQLDIVILILFFSIVSIFVWTFKLNSVTTTSLYFVVPSVYLLFRHPHFRKRILIFSLPLGIFLSIVVEYIATVNGAWLANFPLPRIFTHLSLETFLWHPAWVIVIIAVYQIFIDFRHQHRKISKNYKWFIFLLLGSTAAFIVWLLMGSPRIEYAYVRFFSLPAIAPIVYILIKKPDLIQRFFKFSLILLIFALIYEIIGLRLEQWIYPGQYTGLISLFGVGVPIEEFIVWILLGGASLAAYFEIFMDDLK